MISIIVAALACGLVVADSSNLDKNYCNIRVRWSKWCIGINSRNQARNMPCGNANTKFARFPDGSLRLKGRENYCLKKGSSRDMVYGPCDGAYTFNPVKQNKCVPELVGSYKVYSLHPSYKNQWFDIVGTSPKGDASAIFYGGYENYKQSDHYYDFVNCEPLKCPVAKASNFYCDGARGIAKCPNGGRSVAGTSSIRGCSRAGDTPIDNAYCKIKVHASGWCVGINSKGQARNMPCSSANTNFHRFPDGSLRLQGRESQCLRRSNSRDLEYGSCSGIYQFKPLNNQGTVYPNSYKIFSTQDPYKKYAFDVVGRSPKYDASVILYSPYENYVGSDHYYDFSQCVPFKCPRNFYCGGYNVRACPLQGLSPPLSTSISSCSTYGKSALTSGYCQIVVKHSGWCIGINSRGQARNMPCNSPDTKWHQFPDGSLRLKGKEDRCIKRGSTRDMVYGSCSGAYTFATRYQDNSPFVGSYKIYSTHSSYKNYFWDVVGTSPKSDASAIFYDRYEGYVASDHYYVFKNCEAFKCPANYYCDGLKTFKRCPVGMSSPAGSSNVNHCSKTCVCTQVVRGLSSINCGSLTGSCKCH